MKRYTFTLEETQEIKAARKKNRDKNVEKRLAALEMRAEGKQNKEISEKTGFHTQYITVLVSRYKANGLASITESHYHGNHRNLSYAEEEALLEPFRQASNAGKTVSVHDIETAYREAVGHSIQKMFGRGPPIRTRFWYNRSMVSGSHLLNLPAVDSFVVLAAFYCPRNML